MTPQPTKPTIESHPWKVGIVVYPTITEAFDRIGAMHEAGHDVASCRIVDRVTGAVIYDGGIHEIVDGNIVRLDRNQPLGGVPVEAMRDLEGHGNLAGR